MTLAESLRTYRIQIFFTVLIYWATYEKIIREMVQWWYSDENYSHGFIVPLIAAYFVYERREDLKKIIVEPWGPGLMVVLIGILQLLLGFLASEFFTMRSSMVVILAGIVLLLFGRKAFRSLLLPIMYLFLMIPIPYIIYDSIAFPLKLLVTRISVATLKMIGIVVMREGNIIMFPTTTLEVADACSGIRSLVSLIALAVAYAFFVRTSTAKRWIIIASAIPIALFTNALRVIMTGILAQWWGAKAAEGFFHEFAGLAVFALAMIMLVALGALLKARPSGGDKE